MKEFLTKISIVIFALIALHLLLLFQFDGNTDPYYNKLTGERSSSLVLGGSRASEGINPTEFNKFWNTGTKNDLFNFAFTNSDSPYGSTYFNAIKKKIDTNSRNGVFLLSVHPWNISSLTNDVNDSTNFREKKLVLGTLNDVTSQPNLDYLINYYGFGWGNSLVKKSENTAFKLLKQKTKIKTGKWSYVHEDGWLEVISMLTDSIEIEAYENKSINTYLNAEKTQLYRISENRIHYLIKTIEYLKQYGTVYLIRLPVNKKVVAYENEKFPNFNGIIKEITAKTNSKYIDFSSEADSFHYSDGNHLLKESTTRFSHKLAEIISNSKHENY